MATQAVTSGAPNNDKGTIFHGGTVASSRWAGISIASAMADMEPTNGKTSLSSGTAGSSGNLGTAKAISGGVFAVPNTEGNFIAPFLTNTIAGVASTVLDAPYGGRYIRPQFYAYQRLHITSWNAVTGAASFGAQKGTTVLASGIDGRTGRGADDAIAAIPSEITFMDGGPNPEQSQFKTITES